MPTEPKTFDPHPSRSPLVLRWDPRNRLIASPAAVIVHEIAGYDRCDEHYVKRCGRRIALYHAVSGDLAQLTDEAGWRAWNTIAHARGATIGELEAELSSTNLPLQAWLERMHDSGFVLQMGERPVHREMREPREAELYIQLTDEGSAIPDESGVYRLKGKPLAFELARLFLESFARSCTERKVERAKVRWGGADAYLPEAFAIVTRCAAVIEELRTRFPSLEIEQTLDTHGLLLTDEHLAYAHAEAHHVNVKLWGNPETSAASGRLKDTSGAVLRTLKALRDRGVYHSATYLLDPDSARHYADFVSFAWDSGSPTFIARDWDDKSPLDSAVAFVEPDTTSLLREQHDEIMIRGLRAGFARAVDMIERGLTLPPLRGIGSLHPFDAVPGRVGAARPFVATGPLGASALPEHLPLMRRNLHRVANGENLFDVARETSAMLRHALSYASARRGGRVSADRGSLARSALAFASAEPTGAKVCAAVFHDVLSLEAMRRHALLSRPGG